MGKNRARNVYMSIDTSYTETDQHLFKFTVALTKVNNFVLDASHIHVIIYFYYMVIALTHAKVKQLLKDLA